VPEENPVEVRHWVCLRSTSFSSKYREVENSSDTGLGSDYGAPVKVVFSPIIQVRPRDQPSQGFAMSAHEVDGSDVKPMFPTESMYTTGIQPTQELIEV
jgi:hypothetical protein